MNWSWFFWIMAPVATVFIGTAFILDTITISNVKTSKSKINFLPYRIQYFKKPETKDITSYVKHLNREWWMGFRLSMFNLFIVLPLLVPLFIKVVTAMEVSDFGQPFILWKEALKFVGFSVLTEIWFYISHRILHTRLFYKHIHKLHHHFVTPFAITGIYAHPFEFAFGNALSIALGPMLLSPHMITIIVYLSIAMFNVCVSHSSYNFGNWLSSEFHDTHHRLPDVNFGLFGIMDYLFKTSSYKKFKFNL